MDLTNYLNSKVHIVLTNGFYFKGEVLDADENSITIRDKEGKRVSLSKNSILTIQEVLI